MLVPLKVFVVLSRLQLERVKSYILCIWVEVPSIATILIVARNEAVAFSSLVKLVRNFHAPESTQTGTLSSICTLDIAPMAAKDRGPVLSLFRSPGAGSCAKAPVGRPLKPTGYIPKIIPKLTTIRSARVRETIPDSLMGVHPSRKTLRLLNQEAYK